MTRVNNETLGIAAEKVICDLTGLASSSIAHRSNPKLEKRLRPIIQEALEELPNIIEYIGDHPGKRGGQSKSVIDFRCENGEVLSVKTTKGSWKLCPSECGQPGAETFGVYFGHLYGGIINYDKAKKLVLTSIHEMIPIYLEHLFDNDYLLFIYMNRKSGFSIFEKEDIPDFRWEKHKFCFSQTQDSWNESCTIYYGNHSLGEFQLHQHRNCYKFRFNIKSLAEILGLDR